MIEKHWKTNYILLRNWIVLTVNFFYRKIQSNRPDHKWPDKRPILWAPNHQNSFLDGITLEVVTRENTYHLIRGAAFGSKVLDKIFAIVHLLPIYRERDGLAAVRKNTEIMDYCYDLLKQKESVVVFPEGRFSPIKKVWPLQKGIGRMALGYIEKYGWDTGLIIWPIGLNYNNPDRFGAEVYFNYAEPIVVADYKPLHDENPRKAMNQIMQEIDERLRSVLIDIESEEHYDTIEFLRSIYVEEHRRQKGLPGTDLKSKFEAGKKLTEALNEEVRNGTYGELAKEAKEYKALLEQHKIRDWVLRKSRSSVGAILGLVGLTLLSPFFLVTVIGNGVPYFLTDWIASNKIKERQFRSSILMAASMPFFTLWYLVMFILLAVFMPTWWGVPFGLVLIWVCGYFSEWYYRKWYKKLMGALRFAGKSNTPDMAAALNLRTKIYERLNRLMAL